MKSIIKHIAAATLLVASAGIWAEVAVITHPSNGASIDENMASKLFLGKAKKFPGGGEVVPIDQAEGSATRDEFHSKVTNKNAAQLKAFWSRIVFTGKGQPPKEVGSDAEVMALISANPNMIGYVNASAVDSSVKVVLSVP